MSSVENPSWLFDIGDDNPTQLYGDYIRSQYKDPVINQPGFNGMSFQGLNHCSHETDGFFRMFGCLGTY